MGTATAEIISGRRGFATARVIREDGSEALLHSLYDPVREAASFVPEEVRCRTLVFLGSGLGYHLPPTIALNPAVTRVIIIDLFGELAEAAASRIAGPALQVEIVSPPHGNAPLPEALPVPLAGERFQVIPHPPSLVIAPAWYSRYRSLLATAAVESRCPATPAGRGGARSILFLFGEYYCEAESIRGFRSMGHRVATLDYRNSRGRIDAFQDALLSERPDMVFSVNGLGLDREGVMADILARLRIPLVLWFVDSPEFILYGDALPSRELTSIFLWDRSYLPFVEGLGYRASWLPLAADESLTAAACRDERYRASLSFVGNSLAGGFLSRLGTRFPRSAALAELAERAMEAVLLEPRGGQLDALDRVLERVGELPPGSDERLFFRAYVLHSSTTLYRIDLLRRILPLKPGFFGDPDGWRMLFGQEITVHPDVNYFAETPRVYASSDISFNATSLQMPSGVNQRVFDVPLCGGFLLTDQQHDLFELFGEGEVATYQGSEDVAERARFYLERPGLRGKIARKARERVLKEHTYRHRMGRVVEEMLGKG
jgi:spore maturation protein CgeB